ncbi:MAG TPA: 16S rRNA (cytosine(967)-C(5))-methyltransferase RsmB [Nitrospirales bacterium]|nr:16S rRNA (cytosine(967)-C(5))-methyltransferase RsmB [Nitrospiraceae bacterium]HNP29972.1 16S rRNA (cytosine(967)-C(5))-methyltransferase RsmB [Nitrospirales bacterium]
MGTRQSTSSAKPPASSTVRSWSARKIAAATLQTIERTRAFSDDVFDHITKDLVVSERDRHLAFELVYGVLRHYLTLDWRLDQVSRKPMVRLPLTVATTLRVAAYQLLYLDRIPPSAAVNEAVQLIRKQPGHNWSGFVNAVLRNLLRQPAPPMPDPAVDATSSLSIRYACPPWLVERWRQSFGLTQAERLCQQSLDIPPLTIRTNVLRCSRSALLNRLHSEGIPAQETTVSPVGLTLDKFGNPGQLSALKDGWCYVEDEAAQLIPLLLEPQPADRVLDACAAPGGKTTHLAQLMKNQGTIVALDRHQGRLDRLVSNCARLGISIVQPVHYDLTASSGHGRTNDGSKTPHTIPDVLAQPFDRILVDAPCSGLGILRRHPEGKLIKALSTIQHAQTLQREILGRVCDLLRPGGILVYSACSVEPEETTEILTDFCQKHPEFYQESVTPWVPAAGQSLITDPGHLCTAFQTLNMDGFFACRLKKAE